MKYNNIIVLLCMVLLQGIATIGISQDTYTTFVRGNCGMCKDRIIETSNAVPGVDSSYYLLEEEQLTVFINQQFNPKFLHFELSGVGHSTAEMVAQDDAYHQLPLCCQYTRDHEHDHGAEIDIDKVKQRDTDVAEPGIVQGIITYINLRDGEVPVVGATIQWNGTSLGTVSDIEGLFKLERKHGYDTLKISYVGFNTEYIDMSDQSNVKVTFSETTTLEEVSINAKKKSASFSYLEGIQTLKIDQKEFRKAACCNLAESFITTASIDNTVSDAVTGTQKIEMLGLSSPYLMISRENMPLARGLAIISGLSLEPSAWVESIQINPGVASVANGYEGMTGQINIENKKADTAERLYVDVFGNNAERFETNIISRQKLSKNVYHAIFLHGSIHQQKHDVNSDDFLDMPLFKNFIGLSRWRWYANNGWRGRFGAKYINTQGRGGQVFRFQDIQKDSWKLNEDTKRLEVFNKAGYVFDKRPSASIGTQLLYVNHLHGSKFGLQQHIGKQQSIFGSFIFLDKIIEKPKVYDLKYKVGLSYQGDWLDEKFTRLSDTDFIRNEQVYGAFGEITYKRDTKFQAILGLRGDYHSNYRFIPTARLHMRYEPIEFTVIRLAMGTGWRTANVLEENKGYLASSRKWDLIRQNAVNPYGLDPEKTVTIGLNFAQQITVRDKIFNAHFDAFYVHFMNQVVVDIENPRLVQIYNLVGKSQATSYQLQLNGEVFKNFEMRVALRYNNAQTEYKTIGMQQRPLVAPWRGFLNLSYETKSKWGFDLTTNWISSTRLPSTIGNPEHLRLGDRSPAYWLLFAHISKKWNDKWEVFIGAENLLNYKQNKAILDASSPFGAYFDASFIYAPIFGRNLYIGARFSIK